ncbi:hypothetical protein [Mesonia aestuariivivens]|uniref:Polysaccharide biosynthesis protein n=1 Tax=Mesonia aestuariivivens TaxID=2796128 RepID=A0ABS6W4V9_9FLAO|nr:hypothetical protein [Mesonia aestuariivivens]MBW2962892.1 hypothetical protein [Mesonia aestuariivivens]
MSKTRKTVLYNFSGTLFDKGLPLIIGLLASNYMNSSDFGIWTLYYQFLLIINAVCISSLLGFFNRKFYEYPISKRKMYIYNYPILFLMISIVTIFFYLFFSDTVAFFIIEILLVFAFLIYNYLSQFLRFNGQDKLYMILSMVRTLVFGLLILYVILSKGVLTYLEIISFFLIGHIPIIFYSLKKINFTRAYTNSEPKEFISLASYGLLTSTTGGIDKFAIVFIGNSTAFLGVYAYFYTIATATNLIVEAGKKIFTPLQFKSFSKFGKLQKGIQKKINYFILFLGFLQVFLPQLLYWFLMKLNLVNDSFSHYENPELLILIFSIGFYIFSIYHFINPKLIYYKKSLLMSCSLIISIVIYLILLFVTQSNSYIGLAILKTVLLSLITIFTFFTLKLIKLNVDK